MEIPTTYSLMAHTFTVKRIKPEKWSHGDCVGLYDPRAKTIYVLDEGGTSPGHIFAHELTHCILDAMGHALYADEVFVDHFSGLLHQALVSAKYAKPRQPRRSRKTTK